MKPVSIILANPKPGSFNHAIATAVFRSLEDSGYGPVLHDLCAEGFDPILPFEESTNKAYPLPPAIQRHTGEIAKAAGLVIIHPNWWGQPPAILKGWLDRVLRPGLAYRFATNDRGEGIVQGLLPARVLLVFNTANTPMEQEKSLYGDPLEGLWMRSVGAFLGIPRCERLAFTPVISSTPAMRSEWLGQVEHATRRLFPPG